MITYQVLFTDLSRSAIETRHFFLSTLILLGLCSCDTEIPEVDEISPGFTFSVSGVGAGQRFTDDSDFNTEILELVAGNTYDFAFLATDRGGVSSAEIIISPNDYFELVDLNPLPAVDETIGLRRRLTLVGNPDEPKTALTLSGKLVVKPIINDLVTADIFITVRDFGGSDRDGNTINRVLYASIYKPTL